MRKKILFSTIIAVIILGVIVTAVNAFRFGNVDGVWGEIDMNTLQEGTRLDVVGVIGENPLGGYWGSGTKTTQNDTLVRKSSVCEGDSDGDSSLGEWTGTSPATFTNLGSHTIDSSCSPTDLFFSEYYHSGLEGMLEIFNGTGESLNVSDYSILFYHNGSTTPTIVVPLDDAILENGQVYIFATMDFSSFDGEDQVDEDIRFSGNDAVALVKDYTPDYANGATCDNWATGPEGTSTNLDDINNINGISGTYWDQTTNFSNTDWNQVRYGGSSEQDCLSFESQSGMAFDGVNEVLPNPNYGAEQPFLIGRFCHINKVISSENALNVVPLTITMSEIQCDDQASGGPVDPDDPNQLITDLVFDYEFTLDETTNSGNAADCPYPSDTPCSDGIFISHGQQVKKFRCLYSEDVYVDYTVAPLGFMKMNTNGTCPEWNAADALGAFISEEENTNCGCLYGVIIENEPTSVDLVSFTAEPHSEGVLVEWETANEIENLGFNLYRAESPMGERTQLNDGLIPTNVVPGSLLGASYKFIDADVKPGLTYYYWLSDVDASGTTTMHGPIKAVAD